MHFLIIALKRIVNRQEFDAANREYKFSILLILLHSVLFYFSKFHISVQFLCEITYCKSSSKPPLVGLFISRPFGGGTYLI